MLDHMCDMVNVEECRQNPRPSGDLIPYNMQFRHAPEEPQLPGSVIFSTFNLYLIIDFSPSPCAVFSIHTLVGSALIITYTTLTPQIKGNHKGIYISCIALTTKRYHDIILWLG